jgi:hypothetical protein
MIQSHVLIVSVTLLTHCQDSLYLGDLGALARVKIGLHSSTKFAEELQI